MLRVARSIAAVVAATAALTACHAQHHRTDYDRVVKADEPSGPPRRDDSKLRERIAIAEAKRGAGVDELVGIAQHGVGADVDGAPRALALRALGRIGGDRARKALIAALADSHTSDEAADAIGVLGSLDELSPEVLDELTTALVARLDGTSASLVARAAMIRAIGRAGTARAQSSLATILHGNDRALREDVALALARYGRRKIAWLPALREDLARMVDDDSGRFATIYAFAREHEPPNGEQKQLAASLAKRLTMDAEPAVRAVAAQALAKQGLVLGDANASLVKALLDKDWRVSVEAARALASEKADNASHDAVANALAERSTWANRTGFEDQAVTEMMRLLLPYADRPTAVQAFAVARNQGQNAPPITRMWIECLAADAHVRVAKGASYTELERCPLPPHLVAPLIADLVTDKVGPMAVRFPEVRQLFGSDDPRTRAAAIGTFEALWSDASPRDRDALFGDFESALASDDPIVAGAAIEAAEALFAATEKAPASVSLTKRITSLDAKLAQRAGEVKDPELAASMLALVGKRKSPAASAACHAQLVGEPVIAASARACLRALGEATPDPTEPPAATIPSFPLIVGGDTITWLLTTTRGDITIELDPHEAPWAVSSIVDLTEKHFYDGLEMHRVVPDFVAQGGDPTQSGAGGPGYALPAEPSSNACFVEGGVGMADAGRDTAGSQWFVMHTWAPHLDARYTCVGRVVDGAKAANTLLIGDRILAARIERDKR